MEQHGESLLDEGADGVTIRDYKKIPAGRELIICLPGIEAAISGVSFFGITRNGAVRLHYQDGTEEKAILSDKEIMGAENVFTMTRLVQENARRKGVR